MQEILRAVSEEGKPWIFVASKKDLVGNRCSMGLVGGETASKALFSHTEFGKDAVGNILPNTLAGQFALGGQRLLHVG